MPLLTLLTDFGLADSYVAEVKGSILARAPEATIIDVTHNIAPGDVRAGAHVLGRAWRTFPEGTVHVAVVDPGVGSDRRALAVSAHGQAFLAPDNGLLTEVLRGVAFQLYEIPVPDTAAPTFHGRDVFAPAAARLLLGEPISAVGAPIDAEPVRLREPEVRWEGKCVIGEVIHIDRFGTLITNLTTEEVPPYAVLEVGDFVVGKLHRTFADVGSGSLVAYLGSGGLIEVAVRDGAADRRLGVGVGHEIRARLD